MCCFDGFESVAFGDPPLERWYEATGALPLQASQGFLFGAVVQVAQVPFPAAQPVAQNGDNVAVGWSLSMVDASPDPETPQVAFRFRMFGGAGVVADVTSAPISLSAVVPGFGIPPALTIRVLAAYIPGPGENGTAYILPDASSGSVQALTAAYQASEANVFYLGAQGPLVSGAFRSPNCVHGVVGAEAPDLSNTFQVDQIYGAWKPLVEDAMAIQELPTVDVAVPVTNTDGWRADPPEGDAPTELQPFVEGADTPLDLQNSVPAGGTIQVVCRAPTEFEEDFVVS